MRLPRGRRSYLTATFILTAAGAAVVSSGDRGWAIVAGGVGAWLVQAVAFWVLAGRLETGLDATRAWIGGIVARLGGLAALGVAATRSGDAGLAAAAYGLWLLVLLLAEAVWLSGVGSRRPSSGRAAPRVG